MLKSACLLEFGPGHLNFPKDTGAYTREKRGMRLI